MSLSTFYTLGNTSIELTEPRLQALSCPLFIEQEVRVSVLRLDQIHADLGGNKWYKLKPNIEALQSQGLPLAVSFGGAWSNHLRALAAAGREFGFQTLGFVRGEPSEPLNPLLSFARACGMEIRYLSRADYRRKSDPEFIAGITADLGPHLLIPEGGSNKAAVSGCEELASWLRWTAPPTEDPRPLRYVALACGTGTTMAGLLRGLHRQSSQQQGVRPAVCVLGVSVLKAPGYIQAQLEELLGLRQGCTSLEPMISWRILEDYHAGGYARRSPALRQFLDDYRALSDVPVEPVYTGKLMHGVWDQVARNALPRGSELIVVHSGGLLGTPSQ